MPASPTTPVAKYLQAANNVLATKNLGIIAASVMVLNAGPDACWVTLDGSVPVAADGDGQTQVPSGQALNMTNTNVSVVNAINLAGKTSNLQIVAQQDSDPSGAIG